MSKTKSFSITLKSSISEGSLLAGKSYYHDTLLELQTYEVIEKVFEGKSQFILNSSLLSCTVNVYLWFRESDQQIEFKVKSTIFETDIESKQIFRLKEEFKSLSFLLYNKDDGPQVMLTCVNISKN